MSSNAPIPAPRRPLRSLRAYRVAARVLSSYLLAGFGGKILGRDWKERRLEVLHRRNARLVERTLEELEGLFIKVGQLVSMLTNVLPESFRQELQGLQDHVPARPFAEIAARVEEELGAEPEALFASFDREPLAAASLAQVHGATLADGRRVAVKVQHAGIEATAEGDLRVMRRIVGLAGFILRVRGFSRIYSEVREMILEELDFHLEAENLEAVAANFAGEEDVAFPRVVAERSSRRVLTTELLEGVKVSDLEGLERLGVDRHELAERIVTAYCRMIFRDGLYHADPHPGNLFVLPGGAVAFVDFGAVGRLKAEMKAGIPRFFEGILRRDTEKILEALEQMGFVADGDPERVAERMIESFRRRFLDEITLESWSLQDIEVTARTKMEAFADLRRLDVTLRDLSSTLQVPKDWVLLGRTGVLLTGLCTHLDPEMNPVVPIRAYLEKHVLAENRTWVAMVAQVLKDMALSALALPDDLRRVLTKAQRGELELRNPDVEKSARLLYALGHQLILTLLALAAGTLAYLFQTQGETSLAQIAAGGSVLCLAGVGLSMLRQRKRR
jgi:ubiquinone biosynthesis protein